MSGKEKAEQIEILQQQKVDTARQALGKELLYSENQKRIEDTKFYPTRDSLSQNKRTLTLTPEMKKEYEELASEYYKKYEQQGLYSEEKLEQLKSKAKEYAKKSLMKKYRNELVNILQKQQMLKSHTPFEHEIIQTQKLIKVFKHNPTIIEEFDENLFLQITEHIKIYPDKICFALKNGLELEEPYGKE